MGTPISNQYLPANSNHTLEVGADVQSIICPFTNPDTGHAYRSTWSLNARDHELSCLYCDFLDGSDAVPPEHEHDGTEEPGHTH